MCVPPPKLTGHDPGVPGIPSHQMLLPPPAKLLLCLRKIPWHRWDAERLLFSRAACSGPWPDSPPFPKWYQR